MKMKMGEVKPFITQIILSQNLKSHSSFYQIILIHTSGVREKMPHKKENKHFQDKSEIKDKHVKEEKSSSPGPGILTDRSYAYIFFICYGQACKPHWDS